MSFYWSWRTWLACSGAFDQGWS